jgi:serine protease Do
MRPAPARQPRRRAERLWRCAGAALAAAWLAGAGLAHGAPPDCQSAAAASVSFAAAAARVAPAVVTIIVLRPPRDPLADSDGVLTFQTLSGLPLPDPAQATERSFASGFLIAPDGFILSSAHTVRDALGTWVVLADGRRLPARVQGLDSKSDVALLKIDARDLPVVDAEAAPVCAGDWVAALGTPFGFEASVSAGVVSASSRMFPGSSGLVLIQTDVALNPGSSGGPLFDARGRVVGMNSMVYSDRGVYVGVSFAVPIATVLQVADELRSAGHVRRAEIGAALQPLTAALAQAFGLAGAGRGVLVTSVDPASPAEAAGLRGGDILLDIDGVAATGTVQAHALVARLRPDQPAGFGVWRGRALVRLAVRPRAAEPDRVPEQGTRSGTAREQRLGLTLSGGDSKLPPGAYVAGVTGSSLLAGLEAGDRITAVNGMAVQRPEDVDDALARLATARVVALLVWRGGAALYLPVVRLGE